MRISSRGKYGLKAMADLAINYGPEQIPLKELAARQNIPLKYLEQIFSSLNKAGLVRSVKGAQGGYLLASPPDQITVEEILSVLEGGVLIEIDDAQDATDLNFTINNLVYNKLNKVIHDNLKSINLEDIVNEYQTINADVVFFDI